jgi:hypothetical protein
LDSYLVFPNTQKGAIACVCALKCQSFKGFSFFDNCPEGTKKGLPENDSLKNFLINGKTGKRAISPQQHYMCAPNETKKWSKRDKFRSAKRTYSGKCEKSL